MCRISYKIILSLLWCLSLSEIKSLPNSDNFLLTRTLFFRMSVVDSKAGESWTELDPADDSTYSLPIFLSVGKYSVAAAAAVLVKLLR